MRLHVWAAAAAAFAVSLAYQVALPVDLPLGGGWLATRLARDAHGGEGGYRWTRERSTVRLPGPGPFRTVRVEATVSAWRPRGQPAPRVVLELLDARADLQPGPRARAVPLEARTRAPWDPWVELAVASETFQPGAADPRRLGARLHAVRLSTPSRLAPGPPPLRPVALAAVLAVAVLGAARRLRAPPALALKMALGAALAMGAAHALARAHAVALSAPLAAAGVVLWAAAPLLGRAARRTAAVASEAARRLAGAAARLLPWPAVALCAAATVGVTAAYRLRPVLEIDLGSAREEPYGRGLLAYDAEGGVTFRHAKAESWLDLRDLGGGTRWRFAVRTAGAAGGWSEAETARDAPLGWRAGLVVPLAPPGESAGVRVDRVIVERGRTLPALRVVAAVAAAGLLLALGLAGCGLGAGATAAGLALVAAAAAGLAADPVLALPLVLASPFVAAGAATLALVLASLFPRLAGLGALPAGAVAATALSFAAWLFPTLSPLYRGGHFVFHTSIAEEIWQGRFLLYYLPYPGSMLSHQAQWGNVLVPHPCLFHVLAAPMAALPRPLFHLAVKVALALMLASMVAAAAVLARRLGGGGAAASLAALSMAVMPASYQLLGLGHLMTILGCWAMTMALTFLVVSFDRLDRRGTWWAATALLTVCFLSYTAALLFAAAALAMAAPWLLRRSPRPAARLIGAAATAALCAFGLYYVHWAWPFLSESVPRLLGGSRAAGAEPALAQRLAALPRKLAYTFGTPLVPLAGLIGLARAVPSAGAAAALLAAWGTVLVLFSLADLRFNFLLKHHYFTMVPVAVGLGLLLGRLWERGRLARALTVAAVVALAALGLNVALEVATGAIP